MQEFGDVFTAGAHFRKPRARNSAEFGTARIEPTICQRLVPGGAVKPEKAGHK